MGTGAALVNKHWTPERIGDLRGRTAFITGGNGGIGLETAKVLVRHGAAVILAGRDQGRLDDAAAGLRSGYSAADVGTAVLDLGSLASIAATWAVGRLDDLKSERRYGGMRAYAKSKRANVVFTAELARRLAGTSIVPVAVHPGAAVTGLQRHNQSLLTRLVIALTRTIAMGSPEGAAWPSLYAATSPDIVAGAFYGPAGRDQTSGTPQQLPLPRDAADPAEGARLWQYSERVTAARFAF
ncbi:SDR family NAD(P)-dependent oxidoreductase [Actinoplanes sp. NPDC049596]|uniref:SDR family NAD(P)-dependent oxidoreductase n=1 Tax=unclassified Actinoplanes TaxID=2626549 RepID=UPI0034384B97